VLFRRTRPRWFPKRPKSDGRARVGRPALPRHADRDCPPEVRQLGRTLNRWRTQIAAWHDAQVSNGPTEAMNNLAKRIKRVAFRMTNFRNWRIRVLLYCGRPDWSRLAIVTP